MFPEQTITASQLTFEKWYAHPFVQPLSSSDALGWKDIRLNISRLQPSQREEPGPLSDDHFLILLLEGGTRIRSTTLVDGKVYDDYQPTGSFHLQPAGRQIAGRWYQPITTAFLQFPGSLAAQFEGIAFRHDPAHVEILPQISFHDPFLRHLITELCHELQNPGPMGVLFAESAAQMIMLQVLRKYSNVSVRLPPLRAKLTERQFRVIDDYIESNLSQKISLGELASLLFMSQSHFERLFRTSLGCAPYQYVLKRKIERAQWLLLYSSFSVQQIAEQCGFANQSHFTRQFTHQVSISPARYRERTKR